MLYDCPAHRATHGVLPGLQVVQKGSTVRWSCGNAAQVPHQRDEQPCLINLAFHLFDSVSLIPSPVAQMSAVGRGNVGEPRPYSRNPYGEPLLQLQANTCSASARLRDLQVIRAI